ARDRTRIPDARLAHHAAGESITHRILQRPAEPCVDGCREAELVLARSNVFRNTTAHAFAQQELGLTAAQLPFGAEAKCERDKTMIEKRQPLLDAVRHRVAILDAQINRQMRALQRMTQRRVEVPLIEVAPWRPSVNDVARNQTFAQHPCLAAV